MIFAGTSPDPRVTIDAMLPGGLLCIVADENGTAIALRPADGSADVTDFIALAQLSISCTDQADPSVVNATNFTRSGQMLQDEPPFLLGLLNSYNVFSMDPVSIGELTGVYSCTMENGWGARTDTDSILECGKCYYTWQQPKLLCSVPFVSNPNNRYHPGTNHQSLS